MEKIKEYKYVIMMTVILFGIYLYNNSVGVKAGLITLQNIMEMLTLIPPIFIIMGLLDVWVPKETMIKYMGQDAGAKGIALAFILGSAAAGPLYAAFPIAALLLKKGARFAYVIFFLGVWSSTKLPIVLYEIASLGLKFTLIHIGISIPAYLIIAIFIEKVLSHDTKVFIYQKAQSI